MKIAHSLIQTLFPEVANAFSKIGTSEIANDPMDVNQSDTCVTFKNEKDFLEVNRKRRSRAEVAGAMNKKLNAELPGQSVLLGQPIQMRFHVFLERSKSDVSVRLFGDDMAQLAKLNHEIAAVIEKVSGAGEVETELRGTSPVLKIKPKLKTLRKLG